MAPTKLLAEWFWTDRWMGSSAFLLPMEARGLYREMLTQAWRRGARLPNDHGAIRRACGCSEKEWRRSWPLVAPYWRVEGAWLVNETQAEVYVEAVAQQTKAANRAKAGARARWDAQADAQASARAQPEVCPPSPSPIQEQYTPPRARATNPGPLAGSLPRDHIDHAFCGRFCVSHKTFADLARQYGDGGEAAVEGFLQRLSDSLGPDESHGGHLWMVRHFEAWLVAEGRVKAAPVPAKPSAATQRTGTREQRLAAVRGMR